MRVGIDARTIQGRFTGDATYWRGLIDGLSRLQCGDEFFLYLDADLPDPKLPPTKSIQPRFLRALSWKLWSAIAFPKALIQDKIDVGHVQYTIPPGSPWCRFVTTIHDVSFKRHPEFFRLKDRLMLDAGVRGSLKRASRILACSEYTKQEIVDLYRAPQDKVKVVYQGVDRRFKPLDPDAARAHVMDRYGIESPFVLTVGVIQPRKNLPCLLEAFAMLRERHQSAHKLVIVGKHGWKEPNLDQKIRDLGIASRVVMTGYVADADLPAMYNAADALVYPSVYEGFGLPPLEAMACGTPVITGNRSSLPEVVGEAGIMVDPYDPDAFAHAMANVLFSKPLQSEMAVQGLEQSRRFSCDRMARDVIQIYREASR